MTADEAVTAFSALPTDRQITVLARYAFEMTLVARGTYVPGTEDIASPRRLRLLNEAQHHVTGHICHLLDSDTKRYDDESIVRIVVAEDDAELLNAFETAVRHCG
jgi:hypothetical protein